MSDNKNYYFTGSITGGIDRVVQGAGSLLNLWLQTQILSPAAFGLFVLARIIVNISAEVSILGLNQLVMHRVPKLLDTDNPKESKRFCGNVLGLVIPLGLVGVALLVTGTYLLSPLVNEDVKLWILLLAPLIPITSIKDIHAHWLQANQRMPENFLINGTLPKIVSFAFLFVTWTYGYGMVGIVTALYMARLLPLLPWLLSENLIGSMQFSRLSGEDFRYALDLTFDRLGTLLNTNVDILMLGALASQTGLAIYKVGSTLASAGLNVHRMVGDLFQPRISQLVDRDNDRELKREFLFFQRLNLGLIIGLVVVFLALGPYLLTFFGERYGQSFEVVLVLLIGYVVSVSAGHHDAVLKYSGHSRWVFFNKAVMTVVNVVGNLVLIPLYGFLGAAITYTLATITFNLLVSLELPNLVGINLYPFEIFWKTVLTVGLIVFYLVLNVQYPLILVIYSLLIAVVMLLLRRVYPVLQRQFPG